MFCENDRNAETARSVVTRVGFNFLVLLFFLGEFCNFRSFRMLRNDNGNGRWRYLVFGEIWSNESLEQKPKTDDEPLAEEIVSLKVDECPLAKIITPFVT